MAEQRWMKVELIYTMVTEDSSTICEGYTGNDSWREEHVHESYKKAYERIII